MWTGQLLPAPGRHLTPAQVAGGHTGEYADILADTCQLQHLDCDTHMEKDVGFNTGLT